MVIWQKATHVQASRSSVETRSRIQPRRSTSSRKYGQLPVALTQTWCAPGATSRVLRGMKTRVPLAVAPDKTLFPDLSLNADVRYLVPDVAEPDTSAGVAA